ncbi:polyprenyl synthetase family protein [Luteolibacter sp. AS25]|uniref:polyprenyl synthetase family protein n=1 Tax=Luteolibacter sp. AS25 TaxID=3135776 RepID=UPI00398A71BD
MATFTATSPNNNQFPFALVRPDLEQVETAIRAQVRDFDSAVEPYIAYICNTSGKRIRPALAILVGGAIGEVTEDHRKIGVILELIHMATLVHDDIIDGASARRSMPTANSKWGNALAVLLGDALFSHALTLATDFNSIEICRKVGQAAREVCQGEILQTQRRFDLTLTKNDYFKVIEMKTGALFAAATGLAAAVSKRPAEDETSLAAYGMKLGTAYQIYDDCLDIVGTEEIVGKTLGTDLEKGKLTLPILNLLEAATEEQATKINQLILDQKEVDLPGIVGKETYDQALDDAIDTAISLLEGCRNDLNVLDTSEYKDALIQITNFLESLLRGCLKSIE